MIMEKKSNHFSGQLGFVLAAAGSAVEWETCGDFHTSQPKTEAAYF